MSRHVDLARIWVRMARRAAETGDEDHARVFADAARSNLAASAAPPPTTYRRAAELVMRFGSVDGDDLATAAARDPKAFVAYMRMLCELVDALSGAPSPLRHEPRDRLLTLVARIVPRHIHVAASTPSPRQAS